MTPLPRRPALLPLALTLLLSALPALRADMADASPAAAPALNTRFIYTLRLVERLHDDSGWTKADENVIARHFRYLKAATEEGRVVMAGRTLEANDHTFELVIFDADNAAAAQAFAERDPAVVAGIMTVEVRPFALVLMRKM